MRQAYLEKVESQKMKQKARERMQPKMGKLDIDYQVGGSACLPLPVLACDCHSRPALARPAPPPVRHSERVACMLAVVWHWQCQNRIALLM